MDESTLKLILKGTIILLISIIGYFWKKNIKKQEYKGIHYIPKYYGIGGVIALLISFITVVSTIKYGITGSKIMVIIMMLMCGMYIILYTWVYKIEINENEIRQTNIFGKSKKISFNQVEKTKYNQLNTSLDLYDLSNRIQCSVKLVHFEKIVKILNEKNLISDHTNKLLKN